MAYGRWQRTFPHVQCSNNDCFSNGECRWHYPRRDYFHLSQLKAFTLYINIASFQKQLEDIVEWFVLHRGKICIGLLATAVVLSACSYLWWTIDSLGQTTLVGVASLDGQPIRYGTVTIITQDNKVFTSHISPDGMYKFPSIKPGRLQVAVSSPNPRSVFEQTNTKDNSDSTDQALYRARSPRDQPPPRQDRLDGLSNHGQTTVAAPNSTPPPKTVSQTAQQKLWRPLPGGYANPVTSGLTITATAAGGLHELRLETPQKPDSITPTDPESLR